MTEGYKGGRERTYLKDLGVRSVFVVGSAGEGPPVPFLIRCSASRNSRAMVSSDSSSSLSPSSMGVSAEGGVPGCGLAEGMGMTTSKSLLFRRAGGVAADMLGRGAAGRRGRKKPGTKRKPRANPCRVSRVTWETRLAGLSTSHRLASRPKPHSTATYCAIDGGATRRRADTAHIIPFLLRRVLRLLRGPTDHHGGRARRRCGGAANNKTPTTIRDANEDRRPGSQQIQVPAKGNPDRSWLAPADRHTMQTGEHCGHDG